MNVILEKDTPPCPSVNEKMHPSEGLFVLLMEVKEVDWKEADL